MSALILTLGSGFAQAKKRGTDVDPEELNAKAAVSIVVCSLLNIGCENKSSNDTSKKQEKKSLPKS